MDTTEDKTTDDKTDSPLDTIEDKTDTEDETDPPLDKTGPAFDPQQIKETISKIISVKKGRRGRSRPAKVIEVESSDDDLFLVIIRYPHCIGFSFFCVKGIFGAYGVGNFV